MHEGRRVRHDVAVDTNDGVADLRQSRSAGIFLVPEFRGSPMAAYLDQIRGDLAELREVVAFGDWADFVASGSSSQQLPADRPPL